MPSSCLRRVCTMVSLFGCKKKWLLKNLSGYLKNELAKNELEKWVQKKASRNPAQGLCLSAIISSVLPLKLICTVVSVTFSMAPPPHPPEGVHDLKNEWTHYAIFYIFHWAHVSVILFSWFVLGFEIPDGDADRLLHVKDIVTYVCDKEDVFAWWARWVSRKSSLALGGLAWSVQKLL